MRVSDEEILESRTASAGYHDWKGAAHHRKIELTNFQLRVRDRLAGFKRHAVLRWRLPDDQWLIEGNLVFNQRFKIQIKSTVQIDEIRLINGWESRYYLERRAVKVLEVIVSKPGELTTTISRAL